MKFIPQNITNDMNLIDWFATFAPEPTKDTILQEMNRDRQANPYNDTYKPARRSELEIIVSFKYDYAEAMVNEKLKRRRS